MDKLPSDGSIIHDLLHIFRKQYYEDKKRGERDDHMLLGMGSCMTAIGVMMAMSAFNRIRGQNRSGWSR